MTESEIKIFWQNVAELERRCPLHPLLSTIRRGPSYINARYLKKAFDQIKTDQGRAERQQIVKKAVTQARQGDEIQPTGHPSGQAIPMELQRVYKKQRSLYSQRRALSNKFHTAGSDARRAELSHEIQKIQKMIISNRMTLAMWHKDGIIPTSENELVSGAVEMSDGELVKKRNSLRSALSRYRRELDEVKKSTSEDRTERVQGLKMKISWKKKQIQYVEALIK